MSAIPDGFQADSGRNPARIPAERVLESAFNESSKPRNPDLGSSVSVRSGPHPRETNQLAAAATTLTVLRPDWRHDATRDALRTDPRPWRTVIAAALVCALDPQAHPALIATTAPARFTADAGPTPTPPTVAEWRTAPRCEHGAHDGACALCRRHIPAGDGYAIPDLFLDEMRRMTATDPQESA